MRGHVSDLIGAISMLRRHPVKGFTPEALQSAQLKAHAHFPCDRMYAVEDGPSGFNPNNPGHVSKQKFTVLAFASWLTRFLGDEIKGPLRVLPAPAGHRFMDHPQGYVSIINLASVRDLEDKTERTIDPMRFRANVYVEGWPAWIEMDRAGREIQLGAARVKGVKPIVRCSATCVDPSTGDYDMDLPTYLFTHYNHMHCGLYVSVEEGGAVKVGDGVTAR